jgi:hypothetical protein
MPSSQTSAANAEEMRKAATTVSPKGQAAAKYAKENAAKLPPPPDPKE